MKQQQQILNAQKASTATAGPGSFIPSSTSSSVPSNAGGSNAASLAAVKSQPNFAFNSNTTTMTPQQLAALGFTSNAGSTNGNLNGVGADGTSLNLPQRGSSGSSATSLKANTVDPTMEQISEARAYVARQRAEFDLNRCKLFCFY